jgi:RNA polymerase sigma factor (sigma-70 family)
LTSKAKRAVYAKAPDCADDVAQDAVLAAWQALPSFDPAKSSISTWFSRIVDRTLADHFRSVYREAELFDHGVDVERIELADTLHDIDIEAIREAAGESNACLVDLLLSGCTYAEAAAELGCTAKAVESRIQRIRDRVRR